MCVAKRLLDVKNSINAEALACGRNSEEITLIAVSKTMPETAIMEAYDAGQRVFGENKVQELMQKKVQLPDDISWHLIGHLQTNKVNKIVGEVDLIHSVDSIKLLREINKSAKAKGVIQAVLLEVNVAAEETKSGFLTEELMHISEEISELENIRIKGLMTVAPLVQDSEDNREIFKKLYQLFLDIRNNSWDNTDMCHLSMGMSKDYRVAISEGATYVRVGTDIFGKRNYN